VIFRTIDNKDDKACLLYDYKKEYRQTVADWNINVLLVAVLEGLFHKLESFVFFRNDNLSISLAAVSKKSYYCDDVRCYYWYTFYKLHEYEILTRFLTIMEHNIVEPCLIVYDVNKL